MALEAELLFLCRRGGVSLIEANELELWELASALGLHRVETYEQRDQREIIDTKAAYWEETQEARMAKMAEYSERRAERRQKGKRANV